MARTVVDARSSSAGSGESLEAECFELYDGESGERPRQRLFDEPRARSRVEHHRGTCDRLVLARAVFVFGCRYIRAGVLSKAIQINLANFV